MSAQVVKLRRGDRDDPVTAARAALGKLERLLREGKLSEHTARAYRRSANQYVEWLASHAAAHPDAFVDMVGAEGAVNQWKKAMLARRLQPSTVGQALSAVKQLYRGAGIGISIKGPRVPPPGEPDALTKSEQGAVEREALRRGQSGTKSGRRDAAIIFLLLYTGARVAECARLELRDLTITARTGWVRLHGKGDQVRDVPLPLVAREKVSAYLQERGNDEGPLWLGQKGPLGAQGVTKLVRRVAQAAGVSKEGPHMLRHTYITRLREGGCDVEEIRALAGHSSIVTTQRYFRAGRAAKAEAVERVFDQ